MAMLVAHRSLAATFADDRFLQAVERLACEFEHVIVHAGSSLPDLCARVGRVLTEQFAHTPDPAVLAAHVRVEGSMRHGYVLIVEMDPFLSDDPDVWIDE